MAYAQELAQARKLNKKLTAELQATSSLLNSAARAAELLQKQKLLTKQVQVELANTKMVVANLKKKAPEERQRLATLTPNVARMFQDGEEPGKPSSDEQGLIVRSLLFFAVCRGSA